MSHRLPQGDLDERISHTLSHRSTSAVVQLLPGVSWTPSATPRHLHMSAVAAEDPDDLEERSGLLFSTATRPYIPEDSCCREPPTERSTPVFCVKPTTAAAAAPALESQNDTLDDRQPQRAGVWYSAATPSLEGGALFPPLPQMSGNDSSLHYSASDAHVRLMPLCLSASPFSPGGLPHCFAESSITTGPASLTATPVSHTCGVTMTLEGCSAVPSTGGRLSPPSALLRFAVSESSSPFSNTYLVRGVDDSSGTTQGAHLSFPPSPSHRGRTSSAYMRFERAVQVDRTCGNDATAAAAVLASLGCDGGEAPGDIAAAQQCREAAMIFAAQQMSLCSF